MTTNTKHSVCLLIVNHVPDSIAIIEKLKTKLYTMNMLVSVLRDSNTAEIKNAVDKLTKLNPELVEEIIILIHTRRQPDMEDRKFECEGEIMDIHIDILDPLLSVQDFEDKFKLIIVGGALCATEVAPTDSNSKGKRLLYGPGRLVCILSCDDAEFTTTTVSELIEKKGNIFETLKSQRIMDFKCVETTSQNIRPIILWKSQFTS